ncbi:hypothetical protein B5M09_011936 [Aphanomyces astaci]|uniref:Uncharacterized protein n=1 Tax=Aphanomyces astaci TaxID=112090 RepID=A0A3R7Y3N7_APHAT|nr:hypothetical protein B5M09_011936 [Aphanomyces astaci]
MSRSFSFSVAEHWPRRSITSLPRVLNADLKTVPGSSASPPKLIDLIMEYLAEHRSAKFLEARVAIAALEHLLKSEHGDVERSIALVYASLSEAVRRDAAAANLGQCAHCIIEWLRGNFCSEEQKFASAVDVHTKFHGFKFERYCSLNGSLATFDKLRKAVEKRESTTLSDSHLASVLLSALPDCIARCASMARCSTEHPIHPAAGTLAAMPKAANKESRLRTDAINVTKVRFATTAIATTRAIGPMISSMMIIIVWLLQSCTPSKMTSEAVVVA